MWSPRQIASRYRHLRRQSQRVRRAAEQALLLAVGFLTLGPVPSLMGASEPAPDAAKQKHQAEAKQSALTSSAQGPGSQRGAAQAQSVTRQPAPTSIAEYSSAMEFDKGLQHSTQQLAPILNLPQPQKPLEPAPGQASATDRKPMGPRASSEYHIGPGDVLQISVWREPEVSVSGVAVRSDGKISLPLIKEVQALGMTPRELEEVLAKRFRRFINSPEVTVIVNEIHSEKIYIIGGVVSQGSIELRTPMTVLQALAEAGGLTEFAKKKKIYVLRNGVGQQIRLPFDYDAVLKGARPDQNFFVAPGDTIVVPD